MVMSTVCQPAVRELLVGGLRASLAASVTDETVEKVADALMAALRDTPLISVERCMAEKTLADHLCELGLTRVAANKAASELYAHQAGAPPFSRAAREVAVHRLMLLGLERSQAATTVDDMFRDEDWNKVQTGLQKLERELEALNKRLG